MPVNTSDPIGQYARFVLRPSENVLNELLTGTAAGGTPGTTGSVGGVPAYLPASSATTWPLVETDLDPRVSGDFSFFWYGVLPGDTSQTLMDCSGNDYGWNLTVGTWGPGYVALSAGTKWGGAAQVAIAIPTDGSTPQSICLVYTDSDKTVKLYVGGSLVKTGTVNTEAGVMGPGQTFRIIGDATNPQKMLTSQAFSIALDATQVGTISSNPYAIFTAPPIDLAVYGSAQQNDSASTAIGVDGALIVSGAAQPNTSASARISRTQVLTVLGSAQVNLGLSVSIDPYGRLREIMKNTPTHTWVKVSINSFLDVTIPTGDLPPFPGSLGNSASVIYAWSSFAWDHANGNIVMFGGGHANYFGDELYVFNGDKGLWGRLSLPTLVDLDTGIIPSKDGPQSSHTYSNNAWLPNNRMFVTFGGAAAKSGGPMEEVVSYDPLVTRRVGPWCFDISVGDENKVGGADGTGFDAGGIGSHGWHLRIDQVDAVDPAFTYDLSARSHVGGATVIVDEGGVDVAYTTMDAGGSGFPYWCRYTFGDIRNGGRDTFEKIGFTSGAVIFDGWGVYDPKRGMMYRNSVRGSGNTADISALRVLGATGVTPTTPIQLIDSLGADFPLNDWNADTSSYVRECHYGAAYDPENDRLWLWNGDATTPGRIYYIQLPEWDAVGGWATTTWTINEITPAGSTPRGNHQQGVLGKFRAVPEVGAVVALDSTTISRADDPGVWLFKVSSTNALQVDGGSQGNISSPASLPVNVILLVASSAQENSSSSARISVNEQLAVSNSVQANEIAPISVSVDVPVNILSIQNVVQVNLSGVPIINQMHELEIAGSVQYNISRLGRVDLTIQNAVQYAVSSPAHINTGGLLMGLVTLTEAKQHIRVDNDYEDADITLKILGASEAIINYLDLPSRFWETRDDLLLDVPADIKIACIILTGIIYRDRDGVEMEKWVNGYLPAPVTSFLYRYRTPIAR